MNELTLDGKDYVSSKRAAEITGYAKDYVGQLCREGRIEARLVGRNWYVLKSALEKHRFSKGQDIVEVGTSQEEEIKPKEPEITPIVEESSGVEAIQSAWQEWFNRESEPVVLEIRNEIVSEEHEIAPEPQIEPESPSIPIEVMVEDREIESSQALNLRELRNFQVTDTDEGDQPEVIHERIVSKVGKRKSYTVLRASLVALAVLALVVGYIGAGFSYKDIPQSKILNMLAGVASYNKTSK